MLKALIKKELRQFTSFYLMDRKTGKKLSPIKAILYGLLYLLVFVSLLGSFTGLAFLMAEALIQSNLTWLYFSIMSIITILLGILGSIFNTYSSLYNPKDNDLLISMPIPSSYILISRLAGIYLTCFIFELSVLLPTYVIYCIYGQVNVFIIISMVIIALVLPLMTISFTALLGWLIALVASRFKSNAVTKALLIMVLIAVYYFFCYNLGDYLENLVNYAVSASDKIKSFAYLIYSIGMSLSGKLGYLGIVIIVTAIMISITFYLLTLNFIKVATTNNGEKKVTNKEITVKSASVSAALFKKEIKRFASSTTYMVNCSLASVMLIGLAVLAVINKSDLQSIVLTIREALPEIYPYITIVVAYCLSLTSSMNIITAPTISLEGNNLWIIQSLPIDLREVLWAKKKVHLVMTWIPALITSIVVCYVLRLSTVNTILVTAFILLFVYFCADFGLFINLLKPNLEWVNETAPVKQSFSTFACMFIGMTMIGLLGVGCYYTRKLIEPLNYFELSFVVVLGLCILLDRWLNTKGAKKLGEL